MDIDDIDEDSFIRVSPPHWSSESAPDTKLMDMVSRYRAMLRRKGRLLRAAADIMIEAQAIEDDAVALKADIDAELNKIGKVADD